MDRLEELSELTDEDVDSSHDVTLDELDDELVPLGDWLDLLEDDVPTGDRLLELEDSNGAVRRSTSRMVK